MNPVGGHHEYEFERLFDKSFLQILNDVADGLGLELEEIGAVEKGVEKLLNEIVIPKIASGIINILSRAGAEEAIEKFLSVEKTSEGN